MDRETTTVTSPTVRNTVRWTSGSNLVLGLWLIIAPFLLGYSGLSGPLWNDIISGVLIAALAILRLGKPATSEWASWTNMVIGIWLILGPWVIAGYTTDAAWNDVIVGILVACLAAYSALAVRKTAGT